MKRVRMQAAAATLTADAAARTITGVLVPWGVVGTPSMGWERVRLQFERGAIEAGDRLPLLVDHDMTQPVGVKAAVQDVEEGLVVSWRIPETTRGNDALVDAAEGLRSGLSVGAELIDWTESKDGLITVTRARAVEGSLVAVPAFETAGVTDVAASDSTEGGTMPTTEVEAGAAETETPPRSTASPAVHAGGQFPYGPAHPDRSYFRDLYASQRLGDSDAAERISTADRMLQAAQKSADLPEVIPPGYRPDLYLEQIRKGRPIVSAFSGGSITNATPFKIPRFKSAASLAAAHTEGVNPSDGTLDFDEVTVSPKAYSGKYTVSREMLDAANPSLDGIISTAIAEAFAQVTENAAQAALLAAGQGQATSTATGTDGGVIEKALRASLAKFPGRRFLPAEVILCHPGEYELLIAADATDGRALLPYMNPVNASGSAAGAVDGGLSILGVPLESAWSLPASKAVVARRNDFMTWESALQSFRWEEVAGPANIVFAGFGYFAAQVMRGDGVDILTRSATLAAEPAAE